ncbi:hypothetical protein MHYP_G00131430 [Metynnis hypsauchen]
MVAYRNGNVAMVTVSPVETDGGYKIRLLTVAAVSIEAPLGTTESATSMKTQKLEDVLHYRLLLELDRTASKSDPLTERFHREYLSDSPPQQAFCSPSRVLSRTAVLSNDSNTGSREDTSLGKGAMDSCRFTESK